MKAGLHFWWDLVSAAIRATLIYLGSERRFVLLLIEVFCAVVASRASSETMGCHSQSVDVCDSRRFSQDVAVNDEREREGSLFQRSRSEALSSLQAERIPDSLFHGGAVIRFQIA
jgi:hypothetical protein